MQVVIEVFDPDLRRAGFSESNFQTDVELKLRMAGIKVLTQEEGLRTPDKATFYGGGAEGYTDYPFLTDRGAQGSS